MLLPRFVEDVDPRSLYGADDRDAGGDRPWVLVNMISTADGATTIDGVSGPLGGPPDKRVFAAVRAVADVILVAAGTVRAEGYGPPRPPEGGRAPRLAIVTGSVDLDFAGRVFTEARPGARPIVVTTRSAPAERVKAASAVADIVEAGDDRVDAGRAIAALHDAGARIVLCEGGPSLVGQLVASDLVDELCLSLAPILASGDSSRIAHGPAPTAPVRMRLDRVLEEDDLLFCRYVRR
jgi:riboflavin biosynthesis pyrimidine reductase